MIYHSVTMHGITDRQRDNSIMPTATQQKIGLLNTNSIFLPLHNALKNLVPETFTSSLHQKFDTQPTYQTTKLHQKFDAIVWFDRSAVFRKFLVPDTCTEL